MIDFHCVFSEDDKRRLNLLLDNKRRKKMIKDVRKCSNILFPEHIRRYNLNIHFSRIHFPRLARARAAKYPPFYPLSIR